MIITVRYNSRIHGKEVMLIIKIFLNKIYRQINIFTLILKKLCKEPRLHEYEYKTKTIPR